MITAKVKVSHVDGTIPGARQIHFLPDYADPANAEWQFHTPALALQMTVREEIADRFPIGKSFTLQFVE